jgi:hypothetical protein
MVGIEVSAVAPVYDSPFSTAHVVRPENVFGHVPGSGVVVAICVVVGGGGGGGGGVIPIVTPVRPMHSPASTAPPAVHSARQSRQGLHTFSNSMQSSQQTRIIPPVLVSTLPYAIQYMS